MASAERFSIYPLSFVVAGPLTKNFTQISSVSVSPNSTKTTIIPGGSIDPEVHILSHADPQVSFSTRDLTTLFTEISPTSGIALAGAATFRYQERTDLGTFEGAAVATHETITGTGGFIFPTSLSAQQDAVEGVVSNCTYVPLYNGTTNPLMHNTGVVINAVFPGFVTQYYMGPVYINDVEVQGIQSWNIDFGINFVAKRTQGIPYSMKGAIITRNPVVSFTTLKIDEGGGHGMFARFLAGSLDFYCAKGVNSGARAAYGAGNNHIRLRWTSGDWEHDEVTVSDNDDATVTFTARPTSTVAVDITSDIPQP
jgi:hypothetical protein